MRPSATLLTLEYLQQQTQTAFPGQIVSFDRLQKHHRWSILVEFLRLSPPAMFIQGLSGDPKPWPFSCSADAADSDSSGGPCGSPTSPRPRVSLLSSGCCRDVFAVPGALQSAQTSVLCSFRDISTDSAGVSRRWMMSAAEALRWIHPQSPLHPPTATPTTPAT